MYKDIEEKLMKGIFFRNIGVPASEGATYKPLVARGAEGFKGYNLVVVGRSTTLTCFY